jgi:hypothetical protein
MFQTFSEEQVLKIVCYRHGDVEGSCRMRRDILLFRRSSELDYVTSQTQAVFDVGGGWSLSPPEYTYSSGDKGYAAALQSRLFDLFQFHGTG